MAQYDLDLEAHIDQARQHKRTAVKSDEAQILRVTVIRVGEREFVAGWI